MYFKYCAIPFSTVCMDSTVMLFSVLGSSNPPNESGHIILSHQSSDWLNMVKRIWMNDWNQQVQHLSML